MLDELKIRIENFRQQLAEMEEYLGIAAKRAELERLEAEAGQPGFWNDQARAKDNISSTKALKRVLDPFDVIMSGLNDAEVMLELAEAGEDDALAESVDTLGLAFLLAATAAVGEEIAFRGALQPVFGFWPTAILFALTHMQYTLTPAALIIFGVAIVFGWIRQRFSTTMAIFTHFFYNFIPLALTVALPEEAFALTLGLF